MPLNLLGSDISSLDTSVIRMTNTEEEDINSASRSDLFNPYSLSTIMHISNEDLAIHMSSTITLSVMI